MNKLLSLWFALFVVSLAAGETDVRHELVKLNDGIIESALGSAELAPAVTHPRALGTRLMLLALAYTEPASRYHQNGRLLRAMQEGASALQAEQHPSGLFDVGNLESPPDSAFILETLCQAQSALLHRAAEATIELRETLRALIVRTAEGVRIGGVHTPNHRWHVCAALAHVHRLYPDSRYVDRIDEWLSEGVDQDEDGQYSERSPAYSSRVVNPALLHLALRLNRPELLEPVRRNLEMTLAYLEPNGDVETVASRRQDQLPGARLQVWEYYAPYRYLAVVDRNPRFAAVARWIERDFLSTLLVRPHDPNMPLPLVQEIPELTQPLPDGPVYSIGEHTRLFPGSGLVRWQRRRSNATIYGGSDAASGLGIGSGLAMNPTFFKFRKGEAILESVRLAPAFFGTGFFYSEGLAVESGAYRLREVRRVPYYQPLRAEDRDANGDYTLSADGRFFAKMDFARRPKDYRTLELNVTITETDGAFALEFVVDGQPNVPVTIELAFRGDGALSGVETLESREARGRNAAAAPASGAAESYLLREGMGRFIVGNDTIEFGPGRYARSPGAMENEAVLWVGGSMRAEGLRVYLTGNTPFRHTLTIR